MIFYLFILIFTFFDNENSFKLKMQRVQNLIKLYFFKFFELK